MSAALWDRQASFGIAPRSLEKLRALFDKTPGLRAVWIYGSRARGDHRPESDIDLAVDMPGGDYARLAVAVQDLELIYRVQTVWLQSPLDAPFRGQIMRDRVLFWAPS